VQKASRAIARKHKQDSMKLLNDNIKSHVEEQTQKIGKLADKYNTLVEKVKNLVGVNTHCKKSHKPTLHNVILQVHAERVNKGRCLMHTDSTTPTELSGQIFLWGKRLSF
jgi:hypothetical protein